MRICILCEDRNVEAARERSAHILPNQEMVERLIEFKKSRDFESSIQHLRVPLSENGDLPATHWFCFVNVNEKTYQQMLESQMYTIIEEAVPSEFLAKHNLKRINSDYSKEINKLH